MDKKFEQEMKERIISNLLWNDVVRICEELIDHAERAETGGLNRFLLKTYLLRAARMGFKMGQQESDKTTTAQ